MSIEQNPDQRQRTNDIAETTPDLKALHAQPSVIPDKEHRDDKGKWKKPIAAFALLGAVAAGAIVGHNKLSGNEANPTPDRKPVATSSPNPGEKPANPDTPAAEFGLEAKDYANNPAQAAVDFMDQYNQWLNTGVDVKAANADRRFELHDDVSYAAELNKASDDAFAAEMLVPNWQDNQNLVQFMQNSIENHKLNSSLALVTTDSGTANKEPFRSYLDVVPGTTDVKSASPKGFEVFVAWDGRDNSDMNLADEHYQGRDTDQETGDFTLTFTAGLDGKLLLSNIDSTGNL
jgi:hypothetical protein